jgi:2-haloacid dehalogenase
MGALMVQARAVGAALDGGDVDALGFDVYGTLVDPLAMHAHLRDLAGERATELATTWRTKQIEYAFRRSLMGAWEPFEACTAQALDYAVRSARLPLSPDGRQALLESYRRLPPFPDVATGLGELRRGGWRLFAFSNGSAPVVRDLLQHAGLLDVFEDVVSVAEVGIFKPHPSVYRHFAARAGSAPGEAWLVSSNPWDVVGAKGAGLRAAWVRRSEDACFDPWGGEPDLTVRDLLDLGRQLARCEDGARGETSESSDHQDDTR